MSITISGLSVGDIFKWDEPEEGSDTSLDANSFRERILKRATTDGAIMTPAQLDVLFKLLDLDESGSIDSAETARALSIIMDASGGGSSNLDFDATDYGSLPAWLLSLPSSSLMDVSLYTLFRASGDGSHSSGYFHMTREELEHALDSLPPVNGKKWLDSIQVKGFQLNRSDILDYLVALFDSNADSALSGAECASAYDSLYPKSFSLIKDANGKPVSVGSHFSLAGSGPGNVTQAAINNYLQHALGRFIETFVQSLVRRTDESFKEMDKALRRN